MLELEALYDIACRLAEDDEDENESEEATGGDMYVKYNSTLHGPLAPGAKPPLSVNFLRKFLTIVKRRGRQVFAFFLSASE